MALTTTSSLSQDVQDMIAAEMLIVPDDEFQFLKLGPVESKDAEIAPGTNVVHFDVPTLPTGTYTEASRRLTEGTAVPSTSLAIAMTQVDLTVREYAGPHDGSAINPFGVTEFLVKRAKHDIVKLVGSFLRRDYNKFLNKTIMDLLLAASNAVIVGGVAEGSVTASQAASAAWLSAVNKKLKDQLVPTFPNGRWRGIINTKQESELKQDPTIREQLRYTSNNPLFAGYIGTWENIDLAVDTLMPTKAVGSGGAVTGYQATFFGPYGIGQGITLQPSVREADDTDFQRQQRLIWLSHQAIGTLYSGLLVRGITT